MNLQVDEVFILFRTRNPAGRFSLPTSPWAVMWIHCTVLNLFSLKHVTSTKIKQWLFFPVCVWEVKVVWVPALLIMRAKIVIVWRSLTVKLQKLQKSIEVTSYRTQCHEVVKWFMWSAWSGLCEVLEVVYVKCLKRFMWWLMFEWMICDVIWIIIAVWDDCLICFLLMKQ